MPTRVSTPGRCSPLDLLDDQLRGIERWARSQREAEAPPAAVTREARLDLGRRAEVRRREQAAVLARAEAGLLASAPLLEAVPPARAVVAHRQPWMRDRLADLLGRDGVEVLAVVDDGAEASAAAVVEQPDLLVLEDRLPTLSGAEVVERVRAFAPRTLVAVQALDPAGARALQSAGADEVFDRGLPPGDVVARLVAALRSRDAV